MHTALYVGGCVLRLCRACGSMTCCSSVLGKLTPLKPRWQDASWPNLCGNLCKSVEALQPRYATQTQTTTAAKPSAQLARGQLGACFRCGMYGHWARSCVTQPSTSQQMPKQATPIPVGLSPVLPQQPPALGCLACRSWRWACTRPPQLSDPTLHFMLHCHRVTTMTCTVVRSHCTRTN